MRGGDDRDRLLKEMLGSQYHAALSMLREAVERCPDDLWYRDDPRNAFWQIAYHTLFFTHLYLQPEEAAFRPWAQHQGEVQHPDGIAGPPDPGSTLPLIPRPYSREEVLAYWEFCDHVVDEALEALDLDSPSSGFHWYRIPKLEHQLVNLRHLAHHAGQLADRLRNSSGIGVRWVGAARRAGGD